jgi:hypothetical protein
MVKTNISMQCPRCSSARIQIGYGDRFILARLAGGAEFLCNNCGLEFKGFDLSGEVQRTPVTKTEKIANRRRAPRYNAHLPAVITLAERDPRNGKLILSQASRGHCVTISRVGMAVTFIGSRFRKEEFAKTRRLLLVTITLPRGAVDAVVTTVTHERVGEEDSKARWLIRASITYMNEGDTALLLNYLERRESEAPLFAKD